MLKPFVVFACICFSACTHAQAQDNYPQTMYGTLGPASQPFATSKPDGPLGCDNRRNYKSMSPDTWGEPGLNRLVPMEKNAPDGDNSNSSNPFRPASVPINPRFDNNTQQTEENGFPLTLPPPKIPSELGNTDHRYPLFDRASQLGVDSIIRTPGDQESVLESISELPVPASDTQATPPDYGFRDSYQTIRNLPVKGTNPKFDFESKKKESPGLGEIFRTGRWFGSLRLLYLQPAFQGNTAIRTSTSGVSTPFDFDYEAAPHFQFGFESKLGPGFEFTNYQYDESSNIASFTSDGVDVGTTSAWMYGTDQWSTLSAANAGETINSVHSIDVESFSIKFFKEIKFPVSRLNGKFGLQYVAVSQTLDSRLTDAGSNEIGSLISRSDMNAWGPQFAFEYFRPIGHTKFEFMTRFGGSVLFGRRDQFIQNSGSTNLSRVGADEFVATTDYFLGGQYRRFLGERRAVFIRSGLMFQSWMNGGTAIRPQDDFGLRGFSIALGYNR